MGGLEAVMQDEVKMMGLGKAIEADLLDLEAEVGM